VRNGLDGVPIVNQNKHAPGDGRLPQHAVEEDVMAADQTRSEDPGTGQPRAWQGWQLAGCLPENYERHLVPALFGPWAAQLVELAAPGPGERVLDVACGTGIVARRAAALVQPGGAVAGLDSNRGMLEVARAAAAEVRPVIDWRAGDAADLPFPDGVFEVVLCQQGLQFFPELPWV
jgi:SAM-dependent methyltransferase